MKTLLVVMAHPDDAEILCYGTMRKYVEQGYGCHLLLVTKGEQASIFKVLEGDRITESKNAFMGMDINISCLHFTDGFLRHDFLLMANLQKEIEHINPSVIITHHPDSNGLEHQDHSALGHATYSAAIRYCSNLEKLLFAEPLFSNFISFQPNLFVNINKYFDEKVEIMKCHVSQENKFYVDERFLKMRASSISPYINLGDNRFEGKYELFHQAYAVEV